MTEPPEDEGIDVVPQDEPRETLSYSAISGTQSQQPEEEEALATRPRFSYVGVLTFVGVFLALILAVIAAATYLAEPKTPIRSGLIATETVKKPVRPSVAPSIAPTIAPVAADTLHVTSIALGDVPLAIVNGKRVAEGDWLAVTTASGKVSVKVAKIEDGVVHFDNGQQTIDAKLIPAATSQKAPK